MLVEYTDIHDPDEHGFLVLLLPSQKTFHPLSTSRRTSFYRKPSTGLLNFLLRHQLSDVASCLTGEVLICNLFSKEHGSRFAVFPELHRLNRALISKAALLAFTDMKTKFVQFYMGSF